MVFCKQEVEIDLPAAARLSLWPLTRQRFHSSRGLVWPLDGLTLAAGQHIGTSNQVSDGTGPQRVVITPESDDDGFIVIIDVDHVQALINAVMA
jgi:thiamine pyrophosphokinase